VSFSGLVLEVSIIHIREDKSNNPAGLECSGQIMVMYKIGSIKDSQAMLSHLTREDVSKYWRKP
jgi:hypothetical protein